MKELYDPELTQLLQRSGEYIGRIRPADERTGWILFLVDEVNAFLDPDEYAGMLRELQKAIGQRLDESAG